MATGYSKRSLVEKLGIKEGHRLAIVGAPEGYTSALGKLPPRTKWVKTLRGPLDFIHCFSKSRGALEGKFPSLKQALAPAGMLWISWPKGSSGFGSDLSENVVREIGLRNGLVDVKVCAVDAIWSGLKFVFRLKDRS